MKMILFIRISESIAGASALLEHRILEFLTECRYLDSYPEISTSHNESLLAVTSADAFHEFFTCTIQLIMALLTHEMPNRHQIVKKVSEFILAHNETLASILKRFTSALTLTLLFEIKLISGLFVLINEYTEELLIKSVT